MLLAATRDFKGNGSVEGDRGNRTRTGLWKQSIHFGLVGVLNTTIDFIVFFVMVRWFHWNVVMAQSVSYASGLFNSYVCNRYLTFRQKGKPRYSEFGRFVAVNGMSYSLSILGIALLRQLSWPIVLSKVAVTLVTLAINFIGSKFWVFRTGGKRASRVQGPACEYRQHGQDRM